jgi:hypothetical protein
MTRIQEVKPAIKARFMKGERVRPGSAVYIGIGDEAVVCLTTDEGKSRFEAVGKIKKGKDGRMFVELSENAQAILEGLS